MEEYQKIGTIYIATNLDYLIKTYLNGNDLIATKITNDILDKHPSRRIWISTKDNQYIPVELEFSPNNSYNLVEHGTLYWNIIGNFDKTNYSTSMNKKQFLDEIEKLKEEINDLMDHILPKYYSNFQEPIKVFFIKHDTLLDDDFVD